MNSYREYIESYVKLLDEGKKISLGGFEAPEHGHVSDNAPVVMIFSPHPDDECIVGALALRLLRQSKMRVVNVAVTQGSNKERQLARYEELRNACGFLGFELVRTAERGLEKINLKTRSNEPVVWKQAVDIIKEIIVSNNPVLIMIPHESDSNSSHIGTHFLVKDAMKAMDSGFSCTVCETEFWSAHPSPNLMLESDSDEVTDLVTALSFHVGEVQRNPYHLRMPAWMEDNVRRGGELVGGQGGAAPDFAFATLYRISRWVGCEFAPAYEGGKTVAAGDSLLDVLRPFI